MNKKISLAAILPGAAPFVFLALFYFYPLAALFARSFAPDGALDLSAFGEIAQNEYYREVVWFSLWQAALSTALTLLVGLPAAYVFARYAFPGKTALRALATLPFVMPAIVVATMFSAVIGPRGWLNALGLGMTTQHSLALMFVAHIFYNFTLVLRIVGGFWSNLDPQVEEAAAGMGASRWQVFRTVTLPIALPAIGSAALLVFAFCFSAFGTVLLLAGPRYATLEVEIYTQVASFLNLPVAAALSLLQMAFTLALTVFFTRLQTRSAVALALRGQRAIEKPINTPAARGLAVLVMGFVAALFAVPLLALVAQSLSVAGLRGYAALFQNADAAFGAPPIIAIRNSLGVALMAVVMSLMVGIPATYALANRASRAARWLDPLLMLPIGTSAVTLGLGYILAFGPPLFGLFDVDLRSSPVLIPLAHTLIAMPFVVRSLLPAVRRIEPQLRESAALLGAGRMTLWRTIDLPLTARSIAVAGVFAFTVSMGEFGAALLISRPDFPTISMVIFRFLGLPGALNYATALAMSVLLLVASAIGFVLIERGRGEDEF
ncbi:MAG TPA: iron ABC transporter permease [Thermoflexales bacterium]|nr:iron ABC transporter permease [Thermoflexales bacterium]HRA00496.1 iron ABC transporter permease [Thermoflexales bacterium]